MSQTKRTGFFRRLFRPKIFWMSVVLSLLVIMLSLPRFQGKPFINLLEQLEAKTLDIRFRWRGERRPQGNDIVIIAIDEKTEMALDCRQSCASFWFVKMLEVLQTGGAKVVGFDLIFAEPDPSSVVATKVVEHIENPLNDNHNTLLSETVKNSNNLLYTCQNDTPDWTRFKLTNQSFKELRDENIPEDILKALKPLENKEFLSKKEFLDVIKKHIGEEQTVRYQRLILEHAYNCQEFDYDCQLAKAITRSDNVVLGVHHFFDIEEAKHLTDKMHETNTEMMKRIPEEYVSEVDSPVELLKSYGVKLNLPEFSDKAKSFGHFTFQKDPDGYVRRVPLLVDYTKDHTKNTDDGYLYYPSFALEIARIYLGSPLSTIQAAQPKIWSEKSSEEDLMEMLSIFLEDVNLEIPTDSKGRLFINYYHSTLPIFPHYSLADVVCGKIPPETFNDKIVLVGISDSVYQDLFSTPFPEERYTGVKIQAAVVENILQNDFLKRSGDIILAGACSLLILGIILGIIFQWKHSLHVTVLIVVSSLVLTFSIAQVAFSCGNIWLSVAFPWLFIGLDYLVIMSYKYVKEKRLKHVFGRYVAPPVMDYLIEHPDAIQVGGEGKFLTALFADVRDFTAVAEGKTPENLVTFLKEFNTQMTEVVLRQEGTIDKYFGGAIGAFYGAPKEQPDHVIRACKTAVEMIREFEGNKFEGNIGIGIHSGEMKVGDMGSEKISDYTIVGKEVNLAYSLGKLNKLFNTRIILSEDTYAMLPQKASPFILRELARVKMKSKVESIMIYELRDSGVPDKNTKNFLTIFREGVQAYGNQRWADAIELFLQALEENFGDRPCCEMYISRCEKYLSGPLPKDWEVFDMPS